MKPAGILLLAIVAVAAGGYGASLAQRECDQTAALLSFFRYLRVHVEERIPLRLLLLQYGESGRGSQGTNDPCGPLEECGFLRALRDGRGLPDALRCCDAVGKQSIRLFEEIERALREERSEELLRRFDVWEQTLSSIVARLEAAVSGKKKASITLGICAGALLAILLW